MSRNQVWALNYLVCDWSIFDLIYIDFLLHVAVHSCKYSHARSLHPPVFPHAGRCCKSGGFSFCLRFAFSGLLEICNYCMLISSHIFMKYLSESSLIQIPPLLVHNQLTMLSQRCEQMVVIIMTDKKTTTSELRAVFLYFRKTAHSSSRWIRPTIPLRIVNKASNEQVWVYS